MLQKINLDALFTFIQTPTPNKWIEYATQHLEELLNDHAHCERKAAAAAINLMGKYAEYDNVVRAMSPIAREELLHFEKVIRLMKKQNMTFKTQSPSQYATCLHKLCHPYNEIERLCDQLIIGAIIEARSCERFYALIPHLTNIELQTFYSSLLQSEARHFEKYLELANYYGKNIEERANEFVTIENRLITQLDNQFRFHSGVPEMLSVEVV